MITVQRLRPRVAVLATITPLLVGILAVTPVSATPASVMASTSVTRASSSTIPSATAAGGRLTLNRLLNFVAADYRGSARPLLALGANGDRLWFEFRAMWSRQHSSPTHQGPYGGPWHRAGRPWAFATPATCYRQFCRTSVSENLLGTDEPYVTAMIQRSAGGYRVIGVWEDGAQSYVDYAAGYWACITTATPLSSYDYGQGASVVLTLPARGLVRVGVTYQEHASDPLRTVRFDRVLQGQIGAHTFRRVPAVLSGHPAVESSAEAWCRSH